MVSRRKNLVLPPDEKCPLTYCIDVLSGTWTPNIIWYLSSTPRRFTELKSDLRGISAKVLTDRLRKLEKRGVIYREVMPTSPPTVEYRLTETGRDLKPAIETIVQVGHRLKTASGREGTR